MESLRKHLDTLWEELLEDPKPSYKAKQIEAGEPITMLLPIVEREWISRGYAHQSISGDVTEDGEFYLISTYQGNKCTHTIKMFDPLQETKGLLDRFLIEQHKDGKKVFDYVVGDGKVSGTYRVRVGKNEEVWNSNKRIDVRPLSVDASELVGKKRKEESYISAPIN